MSHTTLTERESGLIIPIPLLVLVGGFFMGAAFLLIPKEEELIDRFLEDKNSIRAHDLVKEAQEKAHQKEAAEWVAAAQEKLAKVAAVAPATSDRGGISHQDTLRAFLGDGTCRPSEVALPNLLIAVRSDQTPDSETVLEQLQLAGAEENMPADDWRSLLVTVAEKALAEGKPSVAADLLLAACRTDETMTDDWDRVRLAVQSCRWSDRSIDAAELLSNYEPGALPEDIVTLEVAVLQELNRNEDAFDAVSRFIAHLGDDKAIPVELMAAAEQTGLYSGQEQAVLPIYRRHLSTTAIGQMEWDSFLAAADAGTLGDTESYTRYAFTFAQVCEWTNLQKESFDHYRKLAVLGNRDAVERCRELYLGLARQIDMEEILARFPSSEPGLHRLQIQLLGENGRYEKAVPAYREWLAAHPEDATAWSNLALLYAEMGEYAECIQTCEEALEIHPGHLGIRIQFARQLQSDGQFAESLEILRRLTPEEHDAITLEDYELVAEAVGAWDDQIRAIQMRIDVTPNPSVDQFESLAHANGVKGDTAGEIAALRSGLKSHPASRTLAMNLASTFVDQGDCESAFAVLSAPQFKDDLAAICLVIDAADRIGDPAPILQFLGPDAHETHELPSGSLMALAEIYEETGQTEAAAQIYEDMPMGPMQWEMIAELRFNQRRFAEARSFQEKITEHSTDHSAWMFLGEILQEMGDTDAAERAFQKSLDLLRARIVSEKRSVAGS